jgi:hypothetical protein
MQTTTRPIKIELSLSSLLFILGMLVYGCTTPPPTPLAAPVTQASLAPETEIVTPASTSTQPETDPTVTVSAPPGLHIVYLREGNLWSWTKASDSVLLTNTGDLSAVRLSNDGQLLAFMRGQEVWTVHTDGTDARLLVTEKEEGSALWFSPVGSLLAVSTTDHIDVLDLNHGSSTTVLRYAPIPNAYYPEIIWTPDESGFKTVIPPNSEKDQAEFLFVFVKGKVANLAKFSSVSPYESLPYISPDGGFVIYVAKLNDGKEALYLMDSSGATKAYGEPSERVRASGWLSDSEHFMYVWGSAQQVLLGDVQRNPPTEMEVTAYKDLRWLDPEQFLALQNDNLYLGNINGETALIAQDVSDYDFLK